MTTSHEAPQPQGDLLEDYFVREEDISVPPEEPETAPDSDGGPATEQGGVITQEAAEKDPVTVSYGPVEPQPTQENPNRRGQERGSRGGRGLRKPQGKPATASDEADRKVPKPAEKMSHAEKTELKLTEQRALAAADPNNDRPTEARRINPDGEVIESWVQLRDRLAAEKAATEKPAAEPAATESTETFVAPTTTAELIAYLQTAAAKENKTARDAVVDQYFIKKAADEAAAKAAEAAESTPDTPTWEELKEGRDAKAAAEAEKAAETTEPADDNTEEISVGEETEQSAQKGRWARIKDAFKVASANYREATPKSPERPSRRQRAASFGKAALVSMGVPFANANKVQAPNQTTTGVGNNAEPTQLSRLDRVRSVRDKAILSAVAAPNKVYAGANAYLNHEDINTRKRNRALVVGALTLAATALVVSKFIGAETPTGGSGHAAAAGVGPENLGPVDAPDAPTPGSHATAHAPVEAPDAPTASADHSSHGSGSPAELDNPSKQNDITIERYSSRTGAGTIEQQGFDRAKSMGIGVEDLSDNQTANFTYELRKAVLKANGLTEETARKVRAGQTFNMIPQEEIEKILAAVKK